jgi:hypothetical protein
VTQPHRAAHSAAHLRQALRSTDLRVRLMGASPLEVDAA